jgi:hypothetical protein
LERRAELAEGLEEELHDRSTDAVAAEKDRIDDERGGDMPALRTGVGECSVVVESKVAS